MPYKFALERPDYSDLASGKVFLHSPGRPAFPVRLAVEILQRCLAIRAADGAARRVSLYDPCCGAAYHLAVLAFLHGEFLRGIVASDIDPQAVSLAERNLDLLTVAGFDRRQEELAQLHRRFAKGSHAEALSAAGRLRGRLTRLLESHPIRTRTFQADALDKETLSLRLQGERIDIVLTDVPYGHRSQWRIDSPGSENPVWRLLDSLHPILKPGSIVAMASGKGQRVSHGGYAQIGRFQIGKRQVVFRKPIK
jgi:hypothetical protein